MEDVMTLHVTSSTASFDGMRDNTKTIPLALNTKGSLIELAHKLKWAHKHYCPKDEQEDSLSWKNSQQKGEELDPDSHIIQGLFCEGRPHPLHTYGESFVHNSLHGRHYTSLGTVHNYNGSVNGLLPAPNHNTELLQIKEELMEVDNDLDFDLDTTNHTTNENILCNSVHGDGVHGDSVQGVQPPSLSSKHELLERFLRDNHNILNVKPSMNNIVGPSLWNLITCTKEVRDLDYQGLMRCFMLLNSSEMTDDDLQLNTDNDLKKSSVKQPSSPTTIRDRMVAPLSDMEISAISSSAIDFVIKHKTPAKVVSHLSALNLGCAQTDCTPVSMPVPPGQVLRKYQCPSCVYQTDNKSHLRRHISSVHFIGMPYYCYICNKEFPRSEKVKAHFLKMHPDVQYDHRLVRKDNFFGVDYSPELTTLKQMENTGHPRSPPGGTPDSLSIKLTPKNMRTANKTPAKTAESSEPPNKQKPVWKGPKSVGGEKRYYCPECPYTGKDIWHLKRHVNDVHQQRKDLKCPLCDYSTGRKHRLVTHMKNHGQLFCFHCDYSTENLPTFQAHVKSCSLTSRRQQHKCQRCERACTNRKQLQDHQFREHGIVVFCCSKCMFYSESDEEYQAHLQQHQDRKDGYVCHICNEDFDDYKSLRSHVSTHRQPPPPPVPTVDKSPKGAEKKNPLIKCPSCEFESPYYHIMKEHKLVHSDKVLKCGSPGCEFSTVWPLSLEYHRNVQHPAMNIEKSPQELGPKGKGTFICPVCRDNRPPFRYKRSFDKHMAQHKQDEEKCPLCAQVFYFRASLKQHLKSDHLARVVEVSSSDGDSSDAGSDDSGEDEDDDDDADDNQLMTLDQYTAHALSSANQILPHVPGLATNDLNFRAGILAMNSSVNPMQHNSPALLPSGTMKLPVTHGSPPATSQFHANSSGGYQVSPGYHGNMNYSAARMHFVSYGMRQEALMFGDTSQAAMMEAYGPSAILHGSMAPFL